MGMENKTQRAGGRSRDGSAETGFVPGDGVCVSAGWCWRICLPMLLGAVGGAAAGLNRLSLHAAYNSLDVPLAHLIGVIAGGAVAGALAAWTLQALTGRVIRGLGGDVPSRFWRIDVLAYLPALAPLAGAWGVRPFPLVGLLLIVLGAKAGR